MHTKIVLFQKPVSSLRSQFENISNLELASNLVLRPQTAIQEQSRTSHGQDHQQLDRASLDIPRRGSPWSTPESFIGLQRSGIESSQVRLQNGPLLSPRPVPATSLPVARSLSLVRIESSSSPPKSSHSPLATITVSPKTLAERRHSSVPGALIPNQDNPNAPTPFKASYQSATKDQQKLSQLQRGNTSQPLSLCGQSTNANNILMSNGHLVPPPANRADKPKIAPKPLALSPRIELAASSLSAQHNFSPLSTAPSTGEAKISHHAFLDASSSKCASPGTLPTSPSSGAHHPTESEVARRSSPSIGINTKRSSFGAPPLPPPRETGKKPNLPSRTNFRNRGRQFTAEKFSPSQTTRLPPLISEYNPSSDPYEEYPYSSEQNNSCRVTPPTTGEPSHSNPLPGHEEGFVRSLKPEQMSNARMNHASDYPSMSDVSRSFPYCPAGSTSIDIGHDARLIDICNRNVCTTGHITRVWDVYTGEMLLSIGHNERDTKVTALAFKPGAKSSDEGSQLWLGTNHGEIHEIDVVSQQIQYTKSTAHDRREVAAIHRHQNAMWTLDDGGNLCVWPGDEKGLPSLQVSPKVHRVQKGHTCSIVIQDYLWLASGKEIGIFRPGAGDSPGFKMLEMPLCQSHIGIITSSSVVSDQTDLVYFGHSDGKVSVYSIVDYTCLSIVSISVYKINSLVGAGSFLWAAFSIGLIFVYDTRSKPWKTKKCWLGHDGSSINSLALDRSSIWKFGTLRLVSNGSDNVIRFWDGILQDDWFGNTAISALPSVSYLIVLQRMICVCMRLSIALFVACLLLL